MTNLHLILTLVCCMHTLSSATGEEEQTFLALSFGKTTGDYIQFTPADMSPFQSSFTGCAWIKRQHDAIYPIVLVLHFNPRDEIIMGSNGYFNHANGRPLQLTGRFPEKNVWFHYCLSWSAGGEQKVYINGEEVGSTSASSSNLQMGGDICLGNREQTPKHSAFIFGGQLFKLNLFSEVLSSSEIRQMSETGMCSSIEMEHETRKLKWERILTEPRYGNVREFIPEECAVGSDGYIKAITYQTSYLKSQLGETRKKLGEIQGDLRERETRLNRTDNKLQHVMTNLNNTVDTLEQTRTQLNNSLEQLKESEEALFKSQENLNSTKQNLEEVSETLNDTRSELAGTKMQLVEAQNEIRERDTRLNRTDDQLKQVMTTLNSTIDTLEETSLQLNNSLDELKEAKNEIKEKEKTLNDTQLELTETQAQLLEAEGALEECDARLNESLSQQEECGARLNESLSRQEETDARLNESLSRQEECGARLNESLTRQEETDARLNESLSQQEECGARLNDSLTRQEECGARLNESLSRQEDCGARLNESISRQEETDARLNESLSQQEECGARLNESLSRQEECGARLNESLSRQEEGRILDEVSRWDVLYTSPYLNKLFTRQLYHQLIGSWGMMGKSFCVNIFCDDTFLISTLYGFKYFAFGNFMCHEE